MADNYIGNRLRELRTKKGVTQTEVAQALGIPVSTYNAWETGQNTPRDESKILLANYFNRTVGFIFFRKDTH